MALNIDWEDIWRKAFDEREAAFIRRRDVSYWDERADDYADYVKTSGFDVGYKVRAVLEKEGVLRPDFVVLDIGAGPGTLTIPFAKVVKRVVAIEPSKRMIHHLLKHAEEEGVENIDVVNAKWQDVDLESLGKFDLVMCSNVCWMFRDVGDQLMRMNEASKRYCCVAISVPPGKPYYAELLEELGVKAPPQIPHHVVLYGILYQRGITANVKIVDTVMRRSVASAIRHLEIYFSTLKELTDRDRELIRRYVERNAKNGIFERCSRLAVIWWEKR